MPPLTPTTDLRHLPVPERKTAKFTFVVQNENGVGIQPETCRLTLWDRRSGKVLNGRDDTDMLNAGPGTVDVNGNGTLTLTPDDMALYDARQLHEDHVALVEWTYNGGAKAGGHQLLHRVQNLGKVP